MGRDELFFKRNFSEGKDRKKWLPLDCVSCVGTNVFGGKYAQKGGKLLLLFFHGIRSIL